MHTRLHVTYFTCDAYQSAYAACTQTCEPQGVSIACRHVCRNTRDAYRWSCIAVCEVVRRDAFSHAGPNGCKHARVLTFNCRRPEGPLEARWRPAGGPLEARWRPAGGPLEARWRPAGGSVHAPVNVYADVVLCRFLQVQMVQPARHISA